jgi:hypothetical protein
VYTLDEKDSKFLRENVAVVCDLLSRVAFMAISSVPLKSPWSDARRRTRLKSLPRSLESCTFWIAAQITWKFSHLESMQSIRNFLDGT